MPVKPGSLFATLPVLLTRAPDGGERRVIGLRLVRPSLGPNPRRYFISQAEPLDLLARKLLGDEGLWWRLLDANPLRYPLDWKAGDVMEIPGAGPATRITRARSF